MKNYTVLFEAFGRKMKCTVKAENEDEARMEVLKKVKFIQFIPQIMPHPESDDFQFLKDILGV